MSGYHDILRRWEAERCRPCIYEHIGDLLPGYGFRRVGAGTGGDHWASPLKRDLSKPRVPNKEKTVVYPRDMKIREQGDWDNGEWVTDVLMRENAFDNILQLYSWLDSRYGLGMPRRDDPKVKAAESAKERGENLLRMLAGHFSDRLTGRASAKARKVYDYLYITRGYTDDAIRSLGFGFVPPWDEVVSLAVKNGYTERELDTVCGVTDGEGRTQVGHTHVLSIPYICSGRIKGFMFRRVDGDSSPKYLATARLDRRSEFFNYPEGKSRVIAVVEGEMDALTAAASDIPGVVAIGGLDITGERRRQVENAFRKGTRMIILCPDLDTVRKEDGSLAPDHAKRYGAVMRSIHTIKDVDVRFDDIYVAVFPEPSDPDEYIRSRGREAFLDLLRGSLPYWEYIAAYKRSL